MGICNRNRIMTGVRFLLRVTLRRFDLSPNRSPPRAAEDTAGDEPGRDAAPAGRGHGPQGRVLLSLSYGCGLRAGEVVRLKVELSTARRGSFALSSPRAARIAMSCCRRRRSNTVAAVVEGESGFR